MFPNPDSNRELLDATSAYKRFAATYDNAPNPLLLLERRSMQPELPRLANRVLLDIGCGTGRWIEIARADGAHAFGIDASPAMLAQAKSKPDIAPVVACGDATALPFATASADVVISSFTVSYIGGLQRFMNEVSRVCKPGGKVFISDLHPEAVARGWRRTFRDRNGSFEVASLKYSIDDLFAALNLSGLRVQRLLEARIGGPERAVFLESGKPELFDRAAGVPAVAVFVCMKPQPPRPRRDSSTIVLEGARVALGPYSTAKSDVCVSDGIIAEVTAPGKASQNAQRIDCTGLLLLPGLINAHDHLEFNLYPRLGNGPYSSFMEWAADIYRPDDSPVREHRQIPKAVRLWCGGLKNLLCGATTVSHHNDFAPEVFTHHDFPVRVVRRYGWAHSLALGDVAGAFRQGRRRWPVIVHVGEGVDARSSAELRALADLDALGPRTVIVHGVAFAGQVSQINDAGAALVWCPSSNCFTLGATLTAEVISRISRVALGTDSAISGTGDLLDEVAFAYRQCGAPPSVLYDMVTTGAADVLRLGPRFGRIGCGAVADIVAVHDNGSAPCERLVSCSCKDIEAVMTGGRPRLLSPAAGDRWDTTLDFNRIEVGGCTRLVPGAVVEAVRTARAYIGDKVLLAGKSVSI